MTYEAIIEQAYKVFEDKNKDYGDAWRILRLSSITDLIYIKANRIRTIQEKGTQKIADDINNEFIGIINYSIMAMIQIVYDRKEIDVLLAYQKECKAANDLMQAKTHDYGDAWQLMRVSSITDIILMKLLRIKQIEDNKGKTIISEGIYSGYIDILNYAVFALILNNNSSGFKVHS